MLRRLISVALVAGVSSQAFAQNRDDFHWQKALASGSDVRVSNINGDIRIVPSTTGRVEVTGIKRGSSRYFDRIKADVRESSRGIEVCVVYDVSGTTCDDRGWNGSRDRDRDWEHVSMDLEVAVPTNLRVIASNVSGDVSITGAHGDIDAGSVSGDVRLDHLHAASVKAHTVSGGVDVRVDEFTGRGDLSFHSVSGDVVLEVPRNFDADLSMSTVSGDINSDFPITLGGSNRMTRRGVEARIGNGGRRLDVSTVSGDLRLRMAR